MNTDSQKGHQEKKKKSLQPAIDLSTSISPVALDKQAEYQGRAWEDPIAWREHLIELGGL